MTRIDQLEAATSILTGLMLSILFLVWVVLMFSYTPQPMDYTDSGVGCLDDCLEPMDFY